MELIFKDKINDNVDENIKMENICSIVSLYQLLIRFCNVKMIYKYFILKY